MKPRTVTAFFISVALAFSAGCDQRPPPPNARGRGGPPTALLRRQDSWRARPPGMPEVFKSLDRNGDLELSPEEIERANALLAEADRNRDGFVTEAEWSRDWLPSDAAGTPGRVIPPHPPSGDAPSVDRE